MPPGAKNYLTPDGAERFRVELLRLLEEERPRLLAEPDEAGKGSALTRMGQRIASLEGILRTAVVTPPPSDPGDRLEVRFGAEVAVRRAGGEVTYRIVGVDETDPDEGRVSWMSPIARALLNARAGQTVRFRFPSGEENMEILTVRYR